MIFSRINIRISERGRSLDSMGRCVMSPVLLFPTAYFERRHKSIRMFRYDDGTRGSMIANGVAFVAWWLFWQLEIVVFPKRWNTGLTS